MILAGPTATIPQAGLAFDTRRYAKLTQHTRVKRLREWARGGGEFLVATNAGHNVHRDAPELVIEAIRRLLKAP